VELGEFRIVEGAKVQDVSNALPGRLGHFGGIPNTASDCAWKAPSSNTGGSVRASNMKSVVSAKPIFISVGSATARAPFLMILSVRTPAASSYFRIAAYQMACTTFA
jgi:hypothetical protein